MKFQNECVIRVPSQQLWEFLTSIPKVATCLPGVEEVNAVDETKYVGIISIKVGIVKLRLAGNISIETMDRDRYLAAMRVEAADKRVSGMIQGRVTMTLQELSPEETKLLVDTDVSLFGKIGEFGQAMIRKKADQMMTEFASTVADRLGGGTSEPKGSGSILGLSGPPPSKS